MTWITQWFFANDLRKRVGEIRAMGVTQDLRLKFVFVFGVRGVTIAQIERLEA